MPDRFFKDSGFGGFQPIDRISDRTANIDRLRRAIETDPDISVELNEVLRKTGVNLEDIVRRDLPEFEILPRRPLVPQYEILPLKPPFERFPDIVIPTVPPAPAAPPRTAVEIDTKLQLLLNAIPIANPGNIITSEYHNALRDAVRALASRIGLSVNPTAEFKILSFAPDFLPLADAGRSSPTAGNLPPPQKWEVALNRAAVPSANLNINLPVSGGCVVSLPDDASILQMIVRGERLDKDKTNPKSFSVKLNRLRFGGEKTPPTTMINVDLAAVKDGYFEEKQTVKLAKEELDLNNSIARMTIDDRRVVNNETHLYYVTAEWLAGADAAAKSEIHSIQIYCTV